MEEGIKQINWNEQFKIRPRRNASIKHELIKTLVVINLIEKYKSHLHWIRVYTEHPIGIGKISDVHFENIKTKEIIDYEIQKVISKEWLQTTNDAYKNYNPYAFKSDWVLIPEDKLPNDINKLNDAVKDLIV